MRTALYAIPFVVIGLVIPVYGAWLAVQRSQAECAAKGWKMGKGMVCASPDPVGSSKHRTAGNGTSLGVGTATSSTTDGISGRH